MFWIVVLLLALSLGAYAYWRVKGGGRFHYGQPELYVVFPKKASGPKKMSPDLEFIRGLQLPESGSPIKPHARPRPVVIDEAAETVVLQPATATAAARPDIIPSRFELNSVASDAPVENGYGDPTLQLLPGRLEIAAGMPGDSVRFVKQAGTVQEITLGRSLGESGSHVQIPSPTVSRLHVKMKYDGGAWAMENLSETNPVSINGKAATGRGAECILSDGDRIEMGEVAFVFRKR